MSKFYCPWCKVGFEQANKTKVAVCPICGKKRNDELNQVSIDKFQCTICGCTFSNSLNTNPICPNACNDSGGKNENR